MILSIILILFQKIHGKITTQKDFKTSSRPFVIIGCLRTFDWKHCSA